MGQVARELPVHLHSHGQQQGIEAEWGRGWYSTHSSLGVARFYGQLIGRPQLTGRWMACVSRLRHKARGSTDDGWL